MAQSTVKHPNAAVAGGTSSVGVALVWFLGNVWPKAPISAELGATIAGVASTVLLFVGRNGIVGVWEAIKHGGARWREQP